MAILPDRRSVLPALFPNPSEFLFVSGLAGASRDAAALTGDGSNLFALGGAMGAAAMVGLGMAVAAPRRAIAAITGDGELLMNVGALVTIANQAPRNLRIVCLDNARHGETGNQPGHTGAKTDLELMARGAGFERTMTVRAKRQIAAARDFLLDGKGPWFLVVKIEDTPPSEFKRLMDPAACRWRFKQALAAGSS